MNHKTHSHRRNPPVTIAKKERVIDMKAKTIALLTAVVMIGSLFAACGSKKADESAASSASATSASSSAKSESSSSGSAGIANPWSEAASAEEAAKGAGLDGFSLVEPLDLSLGDEFARVFRYMEGVAEMEVEYPASMLVIRKGKDVDGGDVSGDYNTYKNTWTQNIKGLEITCFGNRDDASQKTIWTVEDTSYSILAVPLGGDDDFGLSADQLNSVINGLQ